MIYVFKHAYACYTSRYTSWYTPWKVLRRNLRLWISLLHGIRMWILRTEHIVWKVAFWLQGLYKKYVLCCSPEYSSGECGLRSLKGTMSTNIDHLFKISIQKYYLPTITLLTENYPFFFFFNAYWTKKLSNQILNMSSLFLNGYGDKDLCALNYHAL